MGHTTFQSFARKVRTLLVPYYVFSLYFLAKPLALLLVPDPARDFKTGYDYSMGRDLRLRLLASTASLTMVRTCANA